MQPPKPTKPEPEETTMCGLQSGRSLIGQCRLLSGLSAVALNWLRVRFISVVIYFETLALVQWSSPCPVKEH